MRLRAIAVILAVTITAIAATAGPANAATRDQRSTKAFITATLAYFAAVTAVEGQARAAADAVVAHIVSTCPATLAADPIDGTTAQQGTSETFLVAAGFSLVAAEFAPAGPAATVYAQQLKELRWSRRTLARKVATTAKRGLAELALSPPDLCREIASSAATGFAAVSLDTLRFLHDARLAFAASERGTDLLKLMKPYVTRGEAAAVAELRTRQIRLDRFFSKLGAQAGDRQVRALLGE